MTETDDIIANLRTALPGLREQWPIRSLALFGSRVPDDASPDSDLDVLVEFARPVTLSSFLALEERLPRSRDCELILCRLRRSNPILANACEPRLSRCDSGP